MHTSLFALSMSFLMTTNAVAWEGVYNGSWEYGNIRAALLQRNEYRGQQRFNVKLSVKRPGCTGEVDGVGYVSGSVMTFRSDETNAPSCLITLTRSGNKLTIRTLENCTDYSGASCGFGGIVTRR